MPRGALLGFQPPSSVASGAGTRRAPSPSPVSVPTGDGEGNPVHEWLTGLANGERLSNDEVRALRPKLIEAFMGTGDSIDEVLSKTNRHHVESTIWDMDETDAGVVADTMLMLGRKSGIAAGAVRQVAQGYLTVRTFMILAPRMWATAKFYPENGGFGL